MVIDRHGTSRVAMPRLRVFSVWLEMEIHGMFNFAVCGCGKMAHWHAKELAKLSNVKIVAVVDPSPPHAADFKKQHAPDAIIYESLQTLVDKPPCRVDAVVIITPHTLHYLQAKLALERGIHVLVEKPMVTNTLDAYDLWRATKQTNRLLGITFQSPYTANFGYLAGARDAGLLGRVNAVNGFVSQNWLVGTANAWRQDPALSGGGYMYDTGAHLLNAIMWLMNDPVVEVGCFYDKCGSPVDINGVAIIKFQNGAIGSIAIGGNCVSFKTEIDIQTDQMMIITDQYSGRLEMYGREGKRLYPKVEQDWSPSAHTPHLNFVNAILGRESLRAPVRYGVLLSALMDALYESGDSGKIVKVKPVPKDI